MRARDRISTAGLLILVIVGFFGAVIFAPLALGWTPGRGGKHLARLNNIKQRREHDGTDHGA